MIVNTGIRRFLGSAIQRLFNSASVSLPLTHTAIPTRGSIVPTFTRATTSTWPNNDGYMVTGVAGEIGFPGARRVRNLLTFTEDFSNAVWDKYQCTAPVNVVVGPTGRVTNTLTADANGGQHAVRQNVTVISGNTIIWSVYVKAGTASWVRLQCVSLANANCFFNISSGAVGTAVGCTGTIEDAGDGWYRCSIKGTTSATSGFNQVELADGDNDVNSVVSSGLTAYIGGAQLEDVTAQTTQTAGEYVSVGVESAPYYHGSFVDGVKCFPTDLSGNPIPAATLIGYQAQGARTNLTIWNRDLTNAAWTRRSGTVTTALTAVGADGAANSATAVRNLGATGVDDLYQTASYAVTAGVRVEPSLSLRAVSTSGTLRFANAYDVGASGAWNIDLSLVSTTRMERITRNHPSVTITSEWVGGSLNFVQPIFDTTTGPLNFDVDLIQVELGSFASSPIATTTAAVTRNADVDQYPTTAGPIAAAGTVYLDFTPYHAPSGTIALWGTYVDASNYTAILHDATNLIFRKRIAGSNYDATIANAFASGTTYKVAATWGTSGTAIYLDGVAGTPHANTTAAQIAATMQVGADGNSLQQPGAGTTNLRIWQRQLSAPEGVAVTS